LQDFIPNPGPIGKIYLLLGAIARAGATLTALRALPIDQAALIGAIAIASATVVWEPGKKKPKTKQALNLKGLGALDGAFWGLLFGLLFFIPIFGMAVGARSGALSGHFVPCIK